MPDPPTPLTYWPGPDTTGVPAGTELTRSGPLVLRQPGQTITDLHIFGTVRVYADNVTIRRSRITATAAACAIAVVAPAANLIVEDVEIDGTGSTGTAIRGGSYLLRRGNIHHVVDGARLSTNCTVEDCWVHDLWQSPESHNDALHTAGGSRITVRHNRLDTYRTDLAEPLNSCLMLGSHRLPSLDDLLFEDNYCDGGAFTVGVRPDLVGSGILIRNNRFTRNYRYGVVAQPLPGGMSWDNSNVWFDSGEPVLARAGASPA